MSTNNIVSPSPFLAGPPISPESPVIKIRDLVNRAAGLYHADNRLRFLAERCQKRMDTLGIEDLAEYRDILTAAPYRQAEMLLLLNELTIGETCFYRNAPQLEAFRKSVLPAIVTNKLRLPFKHLRIWSAGCSTGEEPYTLAMMCREEQALGALRQHTFEIIATDLNERSLEHARAGVYTDYALRNSPPTWRDRYMTKVEKGWRVKEEVQKTIRFNRLNLVDDAGMLFLKGVDAIFCCNVLIYFDLPSKRRVIQHFYSNLLPNSYLFLGHSESLFNIDTNFKLVNFPGATAYQKVPPSPPSAL